MSGYPNPFTPRGRALIARWNAEIQRSIHAYHHAGHDTEAKPVTPRVLCSGGCGKRTRSENGRCGVCRKDEEQQ